MKKFWLLLSLLVVAALVLSCSPQSSAPPASAPSVQPKYGGVVRYWSNGAIGGFDGHRKPARSPLATWLVFNNLVGFSTTKPEARADNITPEVAERWTVSPDGKTYDFYLTRNIKWHDGAPFTADDVVFSLQKMADPKRSALSSALPAFESVQKTDDYAVKVTLKNPSASFLVTLAGPYAPMEAKHRADANPQTSDFLMGTGPFKFKSMTSGVSYEFVKNPDYWRKDAQGNKLPYLDGVQIFVITDVSAQVDALLTNKVDMMQPNVGVATAQTLDRIRAEGKDAVVVPQPMPLGFDFYLNTAVFKDARLRKAIALLVDPKAMAIGRFGSEDFANYSSVVFAPPYGLPKADIDKLLGRDKAFEQRVTEAQKLAADAGYANGFKVKILSQNFPTSVAAGALLGDNLRRHLKADVELAPIETTAAYKARDAGDYGIFHWGVTQTGDPDDLMPYFTSNDPANFMKYSNAEADKLWREQSQATDVKKRMELTQRIERILLTDLPVAPSSFATMYLAWKSYVKGFVVHNVNYGPEVSMERVWLDK